ncbi:LysE family translocator [Chitinasiproducens palmae]|uniref:Threonine/homoserine/homoserine lactone efflux protein n=1 Tax=Chitinasiproducens palmae TaxID=1770053 RepID=A0A1H2PKL6_9BURK|nr:LysE family translocator [Chitinasiproducens palmae]SDV46892.1 Threonine/homoserine/homoserine lactone efflux protein [Chitinasiproducens palmae]
MTPHAQVSASLMLVYTTYLFGVASPGPSNLAIMSIAGTAGRRAALAFAAGVMSGSFVWAVLATLGLSATLAAYPGFLAGVKLFGGVYLLWLAIKSARSALRRPTSAATTPVVTPQTTALYTRGLLLHLTNPKAVLVWISVAALGSTTDGTDGTASRMLAVMAGCLAIGASVFGGYALVFSMGWARRLYARAQRLMNGTLALVFGSAGVRLLLSAR